MNEADFADIIAAGTKKALDPRNAERLDVPPSVIIEAAQAIRSAPAGERNWRIEAVLTNRIVRDANFRSAVYDAYDNRCAITGLRIIDATGNSEVQAAHIWAVAAGGPDVVQNGLALSATVHWLFDRHLISLTNDYRLLVAEDSVPHEIRALFGRTDKKICLPRSPNDFPHPTYLARHRALFLAKAGQ